MPAYRSDFYASCNIIGYTGNIDDNPTVYFESGTEYGRITQIHKSMDDFGHEDNVGRNEVRQRVVTVSGIKYEYRGSNETHPRKNKKVFYERFEDTRGNLGPGLTTHWSRNVMVSLRLGDGQPGDFAKLYRAIDRFPEQKLKTHS